MVAAAPHVPSAQLGTTDDCGFAPFMDDVLDIAGDRIRENSRTGSRQGTCSAGIEPHDVRGFCLTMPGASAGRSGSARRRPNLCYHRCVRTCVIYPMYVIRLFRAQDPRELLLALSIIRWRPIVGLACAGIGITLAVLLWRRAHRRVPRFLIAAGAVSLGGLVLTRAGECLRADVPSDGARPTSRRGRDGELDPDEKVLAVRVNGEARAYPIRDISYHHVVNDVVRRCTHRRHILNAMSHRSGVEARAGGLRLTFHLAGINNQNFLMRDEETGTYWQQISGAASRGRSRDASPTVHSDELTFATWRAEAAARDDPRPMSPNTRRSIRHQGLGRPHEARADGDRFSRAWAEGSAT